MHACLNLHLSVLAVSKQCSPTGKVNPWFSVYWSQAECRNQLFLKKILCVTKKQILSMAIVYKQKIGKLHQNF